MDCIIFYINSDTIEVDFKKPFQTTMQHLIGIHNRFILALIMLYVAAASLARLNKYISQHMLYVKLDTIGCHLHAACRIGYNWIKSLPPSVAHKFY